MVLKVRLVMAPLAVALTVLLSLGLFVLLDGSASSAATTMTGCAWAPPVGGGGIDGYGADLNSAYWVTSFLATRGAGVTVDGGFPQARYMSISAYNASGPPSGVHLYDAEIQPATGVNRFQTGVSSIATGTYQVQILAEPTPADPAPNTLYVDTNNALVFVLYRVYDSDDSADPTGGVGLPQVSTTFNGIVTSTRGGCVAPTSGKTTLLLPAGLQPQWRSVVAAREPQAEADIRPDESSGSAGSPATEPTWTVANVTRLPNADSAYLEAQIDQLPGQIVVFRGAMPTFPDTNDGDPPWEPAQVRYWSICEDEGATLVPAGCLADHAVVESGDVATFVISTAADQPTNATAANGVNWLPWGNAVLGLVVYRQILAAPSFGQSIAAIPAGSSVSTTMGPYFPQIVYCSVSEFQSAGAAGCLSTTGSGTSGAIPPGSGLAGSGPGDSAGPSGSRAHPGDKLSRAAISAALSREIAPLGKAARIQALLKARGYTFHRYELPDAGRIHLSWWSGRGAHHRKTRIATGTLALKAEGTGTLHMHLTGAGIRLLGDQKHVGLTGIADYSPTGQTAITFKRAFNLEG